MTAFLSAIVALPIAALVWSSTKGGASGFWQVVSNPEAVAALKLTLGVALLVALANAVLGTLTAWVLVRDDFRGKSVVNALIDLPFALPTIVAGLLVLALYGPHSPVGVNVAFTRTAIFLVAALRHAAVRRADGAAGAARARHGDGGGRALARRRRADDVPPDRAAEHPARHPLRA